MKTDRLISIIMVLLEKDRVSAPKLAEMFEVSTRTIYRDLDAINLSGVPIVSYPGVNGGVGIMEGYKLSKNLFTRSDVVNLITGLDTVLSTLKDKEIFNTYAKLKGMMPANNFDEISSISGQLVIDTAPWRSKKKNIFFETVKNALREKRYLIFRYSDGYNKKTKRKVEPYQLILKENNWYLSAYCTLRESFRIFKLSRISDVKEGDIFVPRDYSSDTLKDSSWVSNRIINVTLLFHESLMERICEFCDEEEIRPYDDGRYIVKLPFTDDEYGYSFLLGLGDKCECIEPIHVRDSLIKRIENLYRIYN